MLTQVSKVRKELFLYPFEQWVRPGSRSLRQLATGFQRERGRPAPSLLSLRAFSPHPQPTDGTAGIRVALPTPVNLILIAHPVSSSWLSSLTTKYLSTLQLTSIEEISL